MRRQEPADAPPGLVWLAVGREAARALEAHGAAFAGADAPTIACAEDVHEALATLGRRRVLGCVVSAAALDARPRAALERLRGSARGATLLVLEAGAPDPAVRRAAGALAIHVWNPGAASGDGERGLRPTPRGAAPEPAAPAAPPRPRRRVPAPRTGAPLPRADADPPPAEVVDPGRFAQGCLERIGRLGALVPYVLRTLAEVSSAGRVSLLLREAAGGALRLEDGRGVRDSLLGQVRCAPGAGVAGRVAALGRPLAGRGSRGGPRGYDGSAYVVLPLGRGRACEGVVCLTGLPGDELPGPRRLRAWARLGRQAGTALRSARDLRRARALSTSDALTRLPNRRAFERALQRELERARRDGRCLVVGLLDVDHFKAFNDRYGHTVGDRVLREVARRLKTAFRETDLVTRWGGEEFAVLLPGLEAPPSGTAALPTQAQAQRLLERARGTVRGRPFALGPGLDGARVTVSGGYAVFPEHGNRGDVLVAKADGALYEAKEAGRDRIQRA